MVLEGVDLYPVVTVLTVYGIETQELSPSLRNRIQGCNSTYRLRH